MEIRPMRDEDLDAVVDLLHAALGPGPGGVDRRALFEWKHLRNPFGRSLALVGEEDGRILGLRVFLRWGLRTPAGPLPAGRAVDTATDPAAARQGIFTRLTLAGLELAEEQGLGCIFNTPNARSAPGYLKMGWSEVGTVPISLRAARPARLARAVATRDVVSGSMIATEAGISASEALASGPVTDLIDAMVRPTTGIWTEVSEAFLRWRYADGPIAYRVLTRGEGDALAAGVFRVRRRGRSLTEAVVCDVWARPEAAASVRSLLRELPRAAGADHGVLHLGPGHPWFDVLGTAGYRRVPRMGMRLVVNLLRPIQPDPRLVGNWSLGSGDLEVF